MDSIRRAFGRSPRSSENCVVVKEDAKPVSPDNKNSPNVSEDDIFSDMVINSASSKCPSQNINDIQDLDVSMSCLSKDDANDEDGDDDDSPSAFGFMNAGQKDDNDDGNDVESDSCGAISLCSDISVKKESLSPSPDVLSNVDAVKCETSLDDQETSSISKFSFIQEELPPVPTTKSQDKIPSTSARTKTTTKRKSRSTKPGFANISTDQPKRSPSGLSLEEKSQSVETITTCGDDVTKLPITCHTKTVDTSACHTTTVDTSACSDIETFISEHEDGNERVSKITTNESTDCITTNQVEKRVDITCDFNILDDTNTDRYITSCKNEQGTESEHLNQAYVETHANENDNFVHTVRKDDETKSMLSDTKSSEYENLDLRISEGNDGDDTDCHEEVCREEGCVQRSDDREEVGCVQRSDDQENNDVVTVSDPYNIEMSEEEKVLLKLERLQMQEQSFVKERSESMSEQTELLKQWKSDHLSEGDIQLKITELRELQMKLESKEDYDEAGEINQTILELNDKCENYKYQHPLRDERFLKLMHEYRNLCTYHNHEYGSMLRENQEIMDWFRTKNDEDEVNEEKKLNDTTILLKEKKLKIERDLSHTSLDKEHLLKNKAVLSEEINKQTKELNIEKEELIERRTSVQVAIEELMSKLARLQHEESGLTSLIVDIESKIQNIEDDFQPRIDEISTEEEAVGQKEWELSTKLDDIAGEEERITSRNTDILNRREKTEELISKIACSIEEMEKQRESNEKEMFSFEDSLDFKGLQFDADKDYTRCKEELEELQAKLKDATDKVIADEGQEKRLQRSMNDLEAQLAELQKLKQVHVKERKYKDAKVISEEIKTLTSKGESISCDERQLSEDIKVQKSELQNLNIEISKVEEKFKEKEFQHDRRITENLKKMNTSINSLLGRHPQSWTAGILEITLFNNNSIIHDLAKKHRLLSDEDDEDTVDMEVIKNKLIELESALEVAVTEEDWERAEEINVSIEENNKLVDNAIK